MLPFMVHQFLDVFARPSVAIRPVQIGAYLFGIFVVWALLTSSGWPTRLAFWALATMWAWSGLVYHLLFFSAINPAAWLFSALFVLEAALLFRCAGKVAFRFLLGCERSSWLGADSLCADRVLSV